MLRTSLAILWLFLGASICGALPADAMGKKPKPHQPTPTAVTPVPAPLPAPTTAPVDTSINHGTAQGACWTPDPTDNNWTRVCTETGTGSCSAGTYTGSCILYVSSSLGGGGSCTPQAPPVTQTPSAGILCQTLAAAVAKMRDGSSDQALLKRGDTWTNEGFGFLTISGKSPTAPLLFSYYGVSGARPKINSGIDQVIIGSLGTKGDNLAVIGIEGYAYTRDPNTPGFDDTDSQFFRWLSPVTWLLFEDNKCTYYGACVSMDASSVSAASILQLRRNIIAYSYPPSGTFGQGVYVDGISHRLYEENTLIHNGWNEAVTQIINNRQKSRNIYDQFTNKLGILPNLPVTALRNISAQSSAEGAQFRNGGTITDNLFLNNPIGMEVGHRAADGAPAITTATVSNNVSLQSDDIVASNGTQQYGQNFNVQNATGSGISLSSNIGAHTASIDDLNTFGMILDPDTTGISAINNILCALQGAPTVIFDQGSGNTITPNTTKGTDCNGLGFSAPNRTIGDYAASIGVSPATQAGYLAYLRARPLHTIDNTYTATGPNTYIRAGFGL